MTEQMNILYPKNWTKEAAQEILNFQDLLCRKLAVEMLARYKERKLDREADRRKEIDRVR